MCTARRGILPELRTADPCLRRASRSRVRRKGRTVRFPGRVGWSSGFEPGTVFGEEHVPESVVVLPFERDHAPVVTDEREVSSVSEVCDNLVDARGVRAEHRLVE